MIITDENEIELVEKYRRGARGVFWNILDFEASAREKEELEGMEIYDRNLFPKALDTMIEKHDATNGITWDTVDFWLDELCKLPETSAKQLRLNI
jgi:hypothetical protein